MFSYNIPQLTFPFEIMCFTDLSDLKIIAIFAKSKTEKKPQKTNKQTKNNKKLIKPAFFNLGWVSSFVVIVIM